MTNLVGKEWSLSKKHYHCQKCSQLSGNSAHFRKKWSFSDISCQNLGKVWQQYITSIRKKSFRDQSPFLLLGVKLEKQRSTYLYCLPCATVSSDLWNWLGPGLGPRPLQAQPSWLWLRGGSCAAVQCCRRRPRRIDYEANMSHLHHFQCNFSRRRIFEVYHRPLKCCQ